MFWCVLAAAPGQAQYKSDIGYTSLQQRLGSATPTGAGIEVTQVEAPEAAGQYLPDASHPEFAGKTIVARSGPSAPSSHATTVGRYHYGLSLSIAPGITMIDAYEANNWIGSGFLNTGGSLPATENQRTQNHSWIGSLGTNTSDINALRRMDLVIHRDGVVVSAGVNNGAGTEMPRLLGSAYNVLAVGLTNANSSYGPTTIDLPGRVKPDIVVPVNLTSWAAPIASASAALLLQSADALGSLDYVPIAERRTAGALLVKALLMGGATKEEFGTGSSAWRKGFASPGTDDTVPLDYRYGAGELNVDHSHRILTSDRQAFSNATLVNLAGWDHNSASSASPRRYFFEVPPFSYVDRLSILVTWHRRIATSGTRLTPSLANIDLHLHQASGFTPGCTVCR